MPARHNVRQAAHAALRAWSRGHDYADTLVERHSSRYQLSTPDRHLLHAIVFGVLRNRLLLDHFITAMRKGKLDHETRDLLRIGIYQILFLQIADHAAVNETVEAGKSAVRGLINAVLRQTAGQKKKWLEMIPELPPHVQYSHPEWLYNRWKKQFGAEKTLALMQWDQAPAETFARYNSLSQKPCTLENAVPGAANFFHLEKEIPHSLIQEGVIYIQDLATRHAVELLDAKPNECILDACAAPGGKSIMLADHMQNQGKLIATDSNPKRITRLQENLDRSHVKIAEVEEHDWLTPPPQKWLGSFDGILLDLPCSNTGVLRRRVDARWRLQPEHFSALEKTQLAIVENALPCLKKNGRLVYSTCSLDQSENNAAVEKILQAHPELTLEKQIIITPQDHGTDGAFAALFTKIS